MGRIYFGLAGHPVRGSLSPAIQDFVFRQFGVDAEYGAFEVAAGELADFLCSPEGERLTGLNVTAPLKREAYRLTGIHSETAKRSGAVNTVISERNVLEGYNTDCIGFREALAEADMLKVLRGGMVVCLGAGGAAAGISIVFSDEGASDVKIAARNREKAAEVAAISGGSVTDLFGDDLFEIVSEATLLVNAIPPEAWKEEELKRVALMLGDSMRSGGCIMDLSYSPKPDSTDFLTLVGSRTKRRSCNIALMDGFSMLVCQALESIRLWTGLKTDARELLPVIRKAVRGG